MPTKHKPCFFESVYIRAVNRLKYLIAINRTFLFVLNVPYINTFEVFILLSTWAWTNMDALCKCMFIIIENIVNIEHED